jgi:alpha-tubulin suppressor-like RCC1 family protein
MNLDTGNTPAAAANSGHTCAVRSDGTLWCWRENAHGQLGRGNTTDSTSPVQVTSPALSWSGVTAGNYHSCAVTTGRALYCWGYNTYGQLGRGNTTENPTYGS